MGCMDRESNFNAFVYKNGRWMVGWSVELTFEAPTKEILEAELNKWRGVWLVEQKANGTLLAREGALPGLETGIFYSQECQ